MNEALEDALRRRDVLLRQSPLHDKSGELKENLNDWREINFEVF
jgi:hypothetical protein